MKGTFKTAGVQDQAQSSVLPSGEYIVKVKKVFEKDRDGAYMATQNGDDYVTAILECTEGPRKGDIVFHNVIFFAEGSKGVGITKHFLKVLGENYNPETENFDYDTDRWPQLNSFRVTVKEEEYNGRVNSKVVKVDYLDESHRDQADQNQKVAF